MVKKIIKNVEQKSIFTKSVKLDEFNKIKTYKLKKVLGKNGGKLGRVTNVIIIDNKLVGLVVRKWFQKFYVGTEFIDTITKFTIKLNIEPVITNMGKKVFDKDGSYLGKVIQVIKTNQKNTFTDLVVKKNIISRKKIVKKSEIDINQKNIILNKVYE